MSDYRNLQRRLRIAACLFCPFTKRPLIDLGGEGTKPTLEDQLTQKQIETNKLAREIAHLAHGKALFCLAPVLALMSESKRDIVFGHLADEYADFERPIARLLTPSKSEQTTGAAHRQPLAAA